MEKRVILRLKEKHKKRKKAFKRQEQDFQKNLKIKWRRPRGKQSKLRKRERSRGHLPKVGYGSPLYIRNLNKMGLREVRVFTLNDLNKINPSKEAVLIGKTVGKKKRIEIIKKAEDMNLKIANFNL